MIQPTVGRMVWFYPFDGDGHMQQNGSEPLAAIVTAVLSDRCVNLAVFDAVGQHYNKLGVTLVQPEDEVPVNGYCTWMPFQVGQAQKTEAIQRQLDSAGPIG